MDGSFETPPSGPRCPRCGTALPREEATGDGDCPRCWFALAVETPGAMVGDYRLLGALGEGGTAVVHLAQKVDTEDTFALKLAKPDRPHANSVFENELRNARRLKSLAGIVPVVDHGRTEDGRPFLVLTLMEGGSLADEVRASAYRDRRAILDLIAKLARTLARAHAHAVLHCDLKPENVLFDAQGEPHIADFGVAQQLEDASSSRPRAIGGTRGYMSPEQAQKSRSRAVDEGEAPSLTVSSDVFSLGVLLYWLLARRLPFGNGPDFEERVEHEEPAPCVPVRRLMRALEWECLLICRRALKKRPEDRYRSAAELADDAERALSGAPLAEESARPLRQVAEWVSRHKLFALVMFELALLLLYLPLVPFLVLGQSRSVIEEQNSNSALHQAGAVMNELRDFSDNLVRIAAAPEVQQLVENPTPLLPAPLLERYVTSSIRSFVLFTPEGMLRARWPAPVVVPDQLDFSFRDYYQGARGLAQEGLRQLYVSRIIRSITAGKLELEPSTPMFDERGKFVGVIGAALVARSTFGAVRMNCAGAGSCITGLLAARDRDAPGAPQPEELTFVAAPELKTGEEVRLDRELSRKICRRFGCQPASRDQFVARTNESPLVEEYIDPVSHRPSLGSFAPVGRTGLVVVVATPHSAIRGLTDRMLDKARAYLGVPLLIGVALFGALLASLHVRRVPRRLVKPLR
jgi:serine/threonine protein kinase